LAVPALVRQRALANGTAGQRWLDDLPDVVRALASRWDLEIGNALSGGTASYVAAVVDASGNSCVLKVAMPVGVETISDFERSALVHRLAAGNGCARLLRYDNEAPAMLLERLGRNLDELGMPLPELLETVATTLASFWRPIPAEIDLPPGTEKAGWLADYITRTWDRLDRPCPRRVIDRAVALCERRAAGFDLAHAVLVHGDAHGWNTLEAGAGTYKFVDPEGLRSEPAHDLSVPMREYNAPLLAGDTPRLVRERAARLASLCDVDPEAVWEWGFIERVSTGLANLGELEDGEGNLFLEVAERCL
jgi:streptomycin 6-kinase